MSNLASEVLGSPVTGVMTSSSNGGSTLLSTITRVDARAEVSPVSVVLAVSIVFILAPITISSNTMILAAFYRYKRLRTASNCLLASLAVSDFGVGVFMPFGMHLELSGLPDDARVSTLCIVPYCIVIALCSVSVLVTVAIAVDRLTSLAQPLRYKNIITHSSVEKYIAVFWLYAIGVGFSPLIYAQSMGLTQPHSGSCRFGAAVVEPVRVFLVVAVWAPSALVLLGCYMYVYLVARAHARAIYTVELSFRHQTQTLALPRYGQTLAVTVGAFFVLWLPFQACMLLDIFCGTKIMSEWAVVWLGLPILAHSGANPWIYAFHHGEMRVAATKIAEDVVTRFGIHPSRYGCSPVRRGSNTNLELAEVNKSNDARRPPVEDCFAAKHHNPNSFHQRERSRCVGEGSNNTDISPEGADSRRRFSGGSLTADIIDENNIHDLTKMLKPEYAIDRNLLIDSNHNIEKIKNLKYLLDPTFNKIRHLRRLNHKRPCLKNFARFDEPQFISYQNLKTENTGNGRTLKINAMSDPVLNAENAGSETENDLRRVVCDDGMLGRRKSSNIASMSDPNIKSAIVNVSGSSCRIVRAREIGLEGHRSSVRSLDSSKYDHSVPRFNAVQCRRVDYLKKSQNFQSPRNSVSGYLQDVGCRNSQIREITETFIPNLKIHARPMTVTTNKLANLLNPEIRKMRNFKETRPETESSRLGLTRLSRRSLRHSESISAIERTNRSRFLEPSRLADTLTVPTIHSEPPSPVEPLTLDSLVEEGAPKIHSKPPRNSGNSEETFGATSRRSQPTGSWLRTPARFSDPTIPFVLLNIEDFNSKTPMNSSFQPREEMIDKPSSQLPFSIVPEELAEALLMSSERSSERRPSGTIFTEHDSTRFSSRRPSDLRWSESSRSQEVLSNVNEHQKSPSSYSVNNFESCESGSDLNDVTCLGSFVCPDALTSSIHESLFEAPSVPDSDVFTSFEDLENRGASPITNCKWPTAMVHTSETSVNLKRSKLNADIDVSNQSKSSESVMKNYHAILRLESLVHRNRIRVRPGHDCIINDSTLKTKMRIAPLATPTPVDICTPTFDGATEMKGATGVGVRV